MHVDTTVPGGPTAADPATEAALEEGRQLLAARRPAEARQVARRALKAHGAHAELSLLLAEAHIAEDDEDHEDRAEQTFRDALEDSPAHLGLLTAYAELCLRSNFDDRPARHNRGPALVAEVERLAPGSPQAQRLARIAAAPWKEPGGARGAARAQRADLRTALRRNPLAAAAEQAREEAAQRPADLRRAVLAESLSALDRPGRRLLAPLARSPYTGFLGRAVLLSAAVWSGVLLGLLWLVPLATGILWLPRIALGRVLLGARRRAERPREVGGPLTATAADDASDLPEPDKPGRRELTALALGLVVLLASGAGAGVWRYQRSLEYPRYEAVAPATFRGMTQAPFSAFATMLESRASLMGAQGLGSSVSKVWSVNPSDESAAAVGVLAGVGDLHDMSGSDIDAIATMERSSTESSGLVSQLTWHPETGPAGGWMVCDRYTMTGVAVTVASMCIWGDRGSVLTVVTRGSALTDVEAITRELRSEMIRPAGAAGTGGGGGARV
ncbi:hypothetical protein [Streptomyces sp. NPDC089919]|uniref:tetratricopeptide repeat protein n=1 Tax=Streptomyces sp. NPDC089919 TaxID=3155188 RepID=UPI003435626D